MYNTGHLYMQAGREFTDQEKGMRYMRNDLKLALDGDPGSMFHMLKFVKLYASDL